MWRAWSRQNQNREWDGLRVLPMSPEKAVLVAPEQTIPPAVAPLLLTAVQKGMRGLNAIREVGAKSSRCIPDLSPFFCEHTTDTLW